MVPVQLELKNFLSYGTKAPPLNFDEFEVACLSGGNGEGKSALLDAMTWALWGEARKSSGRRKPDEELIRIGTRHMEVSFSFDLEGSRYRVTRSFSRSATGKTTSSDLEFQLYNAEEDTYRPLTGSNQRETQNRIEDTLGLSYDTFINSAFLLQGRSDEFTNKSPSQRKEILVSILNLSRYEKLEAKARDRWRAAKDKQKRLKTEVERLEEAVSEVPKWQERREHVQAEVESRKETLADLRAKEKSLTEALADLQAKAREKESVESSINELSQRIADKKETLDELNEKIVDADRLLADREEIEDAYDRYTTLQEEREALEEERERHRELEKKLEEARSSLRDRRNELTRRLDRRKVEREGLQEDVQECEGLLEDRRAVERAVRASQAARQQVQEWVRLRKRRDDLTVQQEEARRAIVGARQQIQGELETLRAQIEDEKDALEDIATVEERLETLEEQKQKRSSLEEKIADIESKGKAVAHRIQEQEGQLEARREEYEQDRAELRRFRDADGPTCPTCGTELTPDHRKEVEETLVSSIDTLKTTIEEGENRLRKLKAERSSLREKYTRLRHEIDELEGVEERLATAREQRRALREQAKRFETHKERARTLQKRLQKQTYAATSRRRWQWCAQRRAEVYVDRREYEMLQNQAAQLDRYTERLSKLEEAAQRQEALTAQIEEHTEEIQTLEAELEEGTAFEDLESRVAGLEEKIDKVDFDPDRFQEVRAELRQLEEIPEQYRELSYVKNNRAEWIEEKREIEERIEALETRREEEQKRRSELVDALEEKDALKAQIDDVEEEVEQVEAQLDDVQQTLGMLNERLETAERDQEALEVARKEVEASKQDRQLYKHLRTIFGKHGIPSLIIEETLPEIEERANRILDRLTDGRMHIRLETLKEKKSGGTKETLEIIITDEQGIPRPYETFSGGESFRVNFALRVALAQLLADRSGVRVRTLVIDEGFGTQDEEGIERLVEAIQSIRQDFAKILVITHLQQLKQAFPVRIEVTKDPAIGSTFDVIGG